MKGKEIKIVDVQTAPSVLIKPRPLPIVKPSKEVVTYETKEEVSSVVFTNSIIKK